MLKNMGAEGALINIEQGLLDPPHIAVRAAAGIELVRRSPRRTPLQRPTRPVRAGRG